MTPTALLDQQAAINWRTTLPEAPRLPSRTTVVLAILAEAQAEGVACDLNMAWETWCMLESGVKLARRCNGLYHLSPEDMELHDVLEAIMVDDNDDPDEGTAHWLINRRLLQSGEKSIVHTKDHSTTAKVCSLGFAVRKH